MGGEAYFEEGIGQMAMMVHGLFPKLPTEPVTVGYTWQDDMDIPDITSSTSREFVGETTYTVTGFKEKYGISCVEVATVSTFEFEGKVEQQGEAWLMTGSGQSTGTMLFSLDDGLHPVQQERLDDSVRGRGFDHGRRRRVDHALCRVEAPRHDGAAVVTDSCIRSRVFRGAGPNGIDQETQPGTQDVLRRCPPAGRQTSHQ